MSIKIVISGGCSFTYGNELSDDTPNSPDRGFSPHGYSERSEDIMKENIDYFTASKYCWANLIAKKLGADHINTGRGGRGNSYIARHVLHNIATCLAHGFKREEIFVQVMWSFADRQEFAVAFPTPNKDSPWFFLDPFTAIDETKSDWFSALKPDALNYKEVKRTMREKYHANKELGLVDFAIMYHKIVQAEPLQDSYEIVKNIIHLQSFLKTNNIKYIFTYCSNHVLDAILFNAHRTGRYMRHVYTMPGRKPLDESSPGSKYLLTLRSFIDFNNWFVFPTNDPNMEIDDRGQKWLKYQHDSVYPDYEFHVLKSKSGFNDWATENKYEYATSHPLDKAHVDAAELIYEKIQKIRERTTDNT